MNKEQINNESVPDNLSSLWWICFWAMLQNNLDSSVGKELLRSLSFFFQDLENEDVPKL